MNKHRRHTEVKEFQETVIQIDRVTRVVKGGRRLRFRATVCVGDQKGRVGVGLGKSNEVVGAIHKAVDQAKKNMITINLDGTTIPHDITMKFKSSKLLLKRASEGTGLIAGGTVRKVLELAGVKNVLSKAYGSSNKVNIAKVTFEALAALRETPNMKKRANQKTVESPTLKKEVKTTAKAPAKKTAAKDTKKTTTAKTPTKKTAAKDTKKATTAKAPAKKTAAKDTKKTTTAKAPAKKTAAKDTKKTTTAKAPTKETKTDKKD